MTPGNIVLKTRPPALAGTPSSPSTIQAGQNDSSTPGSANLPPGVSGKSAFLLQFKSLQFLAAEAQRTCVIIYPGGKYRTERASQEFAGHVETRVYEGDTTQPQLEELQKLLDEPALKSFKPAPPPTGGFDVHGSELKTLAIQRENDIQMFIVEGSTRARAAIGSSFSVYDGNAKLVRPLEKWMKAAIPTNHATLVPHATPNNCMPE